MLYDCICKNLLIDNYSLAYSKKSKTLEVFKVGTIKSDNNKFKKYIFSNICKFTLFWI